MQEHRDSSPARSRAFAFLAVLAPFLGGSTELWARGVLLLATGAIIFLWPPKALPGRLWLALAVALAGLGALEFLPAAWFPLPEWRRMFEGTFEGKLSPTLSPQPWLSLEGAGLYLGASVFAGALLGHRWTHGERGAAVRLYGTGLLALAAVALGSLFFHFPVPWWPQPLNSGIGFGFFPNRNQTANVLALAGIMVTALAFENLSRKRLGGYAWFAGMGLLVTALVFAYSRAGIILFFAGATVWVFWSLRFSTSKKGGTLALAAVLLLLTGFLLLGGGTLERFQQQGSSLADYRVQIQRETGYLAATSPWLGQGLGNFEPVFALTRAAAFENNRVLHPESDWLWWAVELGWPAVALLLVALALWVKETFPFEANSDRHLRSAALVCGLVFALHGMADVSGHRAGALWPALFLFSIARHPDHAAPPRPWAPLIFRFGALLLVAFGGWWLTSAIAPQKTLRFPTSGTLGWLENRLDQEGETPEALRAVADAALHLNPLDWNLYYRRATMHLGEPNGIQAAASDFDRARFLEPHWVDLCFGEGKVWLALDEPDLTVDAWREALRRAGPNAPGLFDQMIALSERSFTVHDALAQLAEKDLSWLLVFLNRVDGLEFDVEAGRLLEADPDLKTLSQEQRKALLAAWFGHGDRSQFLALFRAHPEWQEDAWWWLALHCAEREADFERACRFVKAYGPPPILPQITPAQSLAELERAFHFNPEDLQIGLNLFTTLRNLRKTDEALKVLQAIDDLTGRPDYVPYLEAELWAEKRAWEKSWQALRRYYSAAR